MIEKARHYAQQLRLQERTLDELHELYDIYSNGKISFEGVSPLEDYPIIADQIRFEIGCRELFKE